MKNIINNLKSDSLAICFFLLATAIILWQMLLPGYILTLDMVFTPQLRAYFEPGSFANQLPVKYLLVLINFILPGWVIQKLIIFSIFFLAGYLAYKFLPVPKEYSASIWVGLFYMANPFVYQRFLAGHWYILLAYMLLPVLVKKTFDYLEDLKIKNVLKLVLVLFVISLFSLHFLILGIVLIKVISLIYLIKNFRIRNYSYLKNFLITALIGSFFLLVVSSFWLVPFLFNQSDSLINKIGSEDLQVFVTASDQRVGTFANVLALYGFWGEDLAWAGYFIWPKTNLIPWLLATFGLFGVVLTGIFYQLKNSKKIYGLSFLLVGLAGSILAVGVGDSIFKSFNQWLFDHVWFWSGFRDTQKFSALLALSYAYFGGVGFYIIVKKIKNTFIKTDFAIFILMMLPVILTYTIFGGFARQLKPVWYPASWEQINKVLQDDTADYKVLFLPWHQYLSFDFNQKLLIQNPAKDYFGPKVIQGENIELESIYSRNINPAVAEIETILLSTETQDPDEIIQNLAKLSVKYIILSHDLDEVSQSIDFNPANSSKVRVVKDLGDLTIYEIIL